MSTIVGDNKLWVGVPGGVLAVGAKVARNVNCPHIVSSTSSRLEMQAGRVG